jgi:hypothetical protein
MPERRDTSRSLCSEIVQISWTDRAGWPRSANALLEDISPGGASLQTDVILPVSTKIDLYAGGAAIPCDVRYRAFREVGFFVGVQFANGYRWSRRQYLPKHLL